MHNTSPNIKAKNLFMKGSINNLGTSKNNGMKKTAKYSIKSTKREKSFYCLSFKTIVKSLLKGSSIKNKLWLETSIKLSIKKNKSSKNLTLCFTESFIRTSMMKKTKSQSIKNNWKRKNFENLSHTASKLSQKNTNPQLTRWNNLKYNLWLNKK